MKENRWYCYWILLLLLFYTYSLVRVRNAYIRVCKVTLNTVYICNRSSVQIFCYCCSV